MTRARRPAGGPRNHGGGCDDAPSPAAAVVPSIVDAMPAGGMAALLADPSSRAAHVDAIARFAAEGEYDGIDIDYEVLGQNNGMLMVSVSGSAVVC